MESSSWVVRKACWLLPQPRPPFVVPGAGVCWDNNFCWRVNLFPHLQGRQCVIHSFLTAEDLELSRTDPVLEGDLRAFQVTHLDFFPGHTFGFLPRRDGQSVPWLSLWTGGCQLLLQLWVGFARKTMGGGPLIPAFKTACFYLVSEIRSGLVFPWFI